MNARAGSLSSSLERSDRVALEAPVVAFGLLEHLPECALPLARLLVLLLDPKGDLHHASRDVPIAPQRLHSLVIIARPRSLVEERPPSVLVLTDQLDLLERVLRLPLLNLLTDLTDRGLRCDRYREHAQCGEDLHLRHVVLIALRNLRGALLDETTLL